jgi:hypothetical protein
LSLERELIQQRTLRIREIEALGFKAYGQRFDATHQIPRLLADSNSKTAEELDSKRSR